MNYSLTEYDLECVLQFVAKEIERKMTSGDQGEIDLVSLFREGYGRLNPQTKATSDE